MKFNKKMKRKIETLKKEKFILNGEIKQMKD